jgi:hypothetical protein
MKAPCSNAAWAVLINSVSWHDRAGGKNFVMPPPPSPLATYFLFEGLIFGSFHALA